MAIVKLGSIVVGVRGSIGGVTYSAGLGGPYAKAFGRSSNPKAARQQVVRANVGNLGAVWQGMSSTLRGDWDTFAATDPEPTFNSLGEPVVLSGWGYFVRCNVRRQQNAQSIITAVPTGGDATAPGQFTVTTFNVQTVTSPQIILNYLPIASPSGAYIVVFLVVLPTGGTTYNPQRLAWIGSHTANDSAYNPYSAFLALFGQCPIGWGVAGRVYCQNASGLRGDATEIYAKILG